MSSKYDPLCRLICATYHAEAVVVIVLGGTEGDGACRAETPIFDPTLQEKRRAKLAAQLRILAHAVETQSIPNDPQGPHS